MTYRTWLAEFMPRPASATSIEEAAEHSIRKWTGVLSENLARHGLELRDGKIMQDGMCVLYLDGSSCALCVHYFYGDERCGGCPIYENTGRTCEDSESLYAAITEDEVGSDDDIRALIEAIKEPKPE